MDPAIAEGVRTALADLDEKIGMGKRGKPMAEKQFKQVCECQHCGNEAEMVVTCSLEEHQPKPKIVAQSEGKTKGHAVCSHCGGEADIWLDV